MFAIIIKSHGYTRKRKTQYIINFSSSAFMSFKPAMHPPTLLTLPPELRNQILETLFYGAELSTTLLCKHHHHRPNPFQRANYGILAANKQLHREASTILFHGAVLRLDIVPNMTIDDRYVPRFATKTVVPLWSWYVRDRYRDSGGTDLEFLRRWQGLKKVRHVELSLVPVPLKRDVGWRAISPGLLGRYLEDCCEMVVGFVNGLPEVERLIVSIDADGSFRMEKCKDKLRALTTAKLVTTAKGDDCRCRS